MIKSKYEMWKITKGIKRILGVHLLRPVPPSNANRGENGLPKCFHHPSGKRGMNSSATFKTDWLHSESSRLLAEKFPEFEIPVRTRIHICQIVERAKEELAAGRITEEVFVKTVRSCLCAAMVLQGKDRKAFMGKSTPGGIDSALRQIGIIRDGVESVEPVDDEVENLSTPEEKSKMLHSQLSLLSKRAYDEIERIIVSCVDTPVDKIFPVMLEQIQTLRHRTGVGVWESMFGNFSPGGGSMQIEAACCLSPSMATSHTETISQDFFVCLDDLKGEVGHMGHRYTMNGVHYQVAGIDLFTQAKNTGETDIHKVKEIVALLLRGLFLASPKGNKTRAPRETLPFMAMFSMATQALSYYPAYEMSSIDHPKFREMRDEAHVAVYQLGEYLRGITSMWTTYKEDRAYIVHPSYEDVEMPALRLANDEQLIQWLVDYKIE